MKLLKFAPFVLLATAFSALATTLPSSSDLQQQDQRLLQISNAIMAANAALCDRTMPNLGVALQSTDQYPAGAAPPFAAPVAFAAVIPGSAAAQAGIAPDDGLVTIDGRAITKLPALSAAPLRDSAFAVVAQHPAGAPLVLGVVHGTEHREVTLHASPECRVLVEVLADKGSTAHSDGRVIQFSYGLVTRADDRQLAAMFAHELGHVVLHHRERLSAAGVKKGLLGAIGRDRRLNLQAEAEADRMSVYLLANAGIDPRSGPGLWRSDLGRRLSAGHQSGTERAKLMEQEIAAHLGGSSPYLPGELLAQRTQPMR